ncbi:hypothetical protein CSUI_006309 [Cystoisospora suis]|uniref:Uncharacterized protein n=1 Tax=Cystoisospora suis TaxID=483139 RepID=A0A2C6KH96_9APIC|nr:hypothetical protein CSUI_006309 [Cystoisospora suis]
MTCPSRRAQSFTPDERKILADAFGALVLPVTFPCVSSGDTFCIFVTLLRNCLRRDTED